MKSMNKIFAFFAAVLLSLGFAACCLKIPFLSSAIGAVGNINLLTYGMLLILFCLLFVVFYGAADWKKAGGRVSSARSLAVVLCLMLGTLVFFVRMFQMEGNVYGGVSDRYVWHKLPLWLVVLCLSVILVLFFLCIRQNTLRMPEGAYYLLYGMLTVLIGYTYYTPSIFVRGYSDRLHAHAYYNSIYNVMQGSPYSEMTTSIYGHYGILYKLPMKILGGDFIDFILLNAILGAVCFLAMFLALHFLVKNGLLRVLGAVAMTFPILSMRGGYYWQLWPHRILFMSLLLCLGAFCVRFRRCSRITCLVGYLLSLLGVLWNTESGMFCAVSWAGFWILRELCRSPWRPVRILRSFVLHFLGILFCFFGAYGIVNLYNLLAGGTVNSVREFLFPLLTTSYMDDLLRVDLPEFPSAYIPVLILFLLAVSWGLSHMGCFRGNQGETEEQYLVPCFAFSAGVLALGQMSYFINRAAYHNLDICHLPAMLLICVTAQWGMETVKKFRWQERRSWAPEKLYQGALTAVSLGVLVTVTLGNLIQYGYNTDLKTAFHNKDEIHQFAAHIAANIPENTYGFGIGVAEIYSMLRWDTGCYTLDFSDISVRPQVANYVINDIRTKEIPDFLVGEKTMEKLENFASDQNQWIEENYELSQEFEFQGAVFQYYVRKS